MGNLGIMSVSNNAIQYILYIQNNTVVYVYCGLFAVSGKSARPII